MSVAYKVPRGTRANLDAMATAGTIAVGQVYLITDEDRLAVGTSTTTYEAFALESEAASGSSDSSDEIDDSFDRDDTTASTTGWGSTDTGQTWVAVGDCTGFISGGTAVFSAGQNYPMMAVDTGSNDMVVQVTTNGNGATRLVAHCNSTFDNFVALDVGGGNTAFFYWDGTTTQEIQYSAAVTGASALKISVSGITATAFVNDEEIASFSFADMTDGTYACLGEGSNPSTGNIALANFSVVTGTPPTVDWGSITGTIEDQSDLSGLLDSKANLFSPALTGVPTAPTPTTGDNSTTVATTEFVTTAVAGASAPAPAWGAITGTLSDQTDLNTALAALAPTASPTFTGTVTIPTPTTGDNTTKAASTAFVTTAVSSKANLASPTFTGTPAAPTASTSTSSTQIATTAFVKNQAYATLASPTLTGTPAAPTAAAGTNTTQLATTAFVTTANSSKANLASPTFTGTPAAPTPASTDNSTTLATTAYVQTAIPPKGTSVSCSGAPANGEIIGLWIAPYAMTLSATNSIFKAVTAATASTVLTVKQNGTSIGTVTFAASGTTGSVSFTSTSIASGDLITVVNQASADATLSDIAGLLRA